MTARSEKRSLHRPVARARGGTVRSACCCSALQARCAASVRSATCESPSVVRLLRSLHCLRLGAVDDHLAAALVRYGHDRCTLRVELGATARGSLQALRTRGVQGRAARALCTSRPSAAGGAFAGAGAISAFAKLDAARRFTAEPGSACSTLTASARSTVAGSARSTVAAPAGATVL